MYPFASLPENLIAFGKFLRKEQGFRLGSGELHDAARALEIVDLSNELSVRDALRPILSKTEKEAAIFDGAFVAFFYPLPTGLDRPEPESRGRQPHSADEERDKAKGDLLADLAGPEESPDTALDRAAPVQTEPDARPQLLARASYSPMPVEAAGDSPELFRADSSWRNAARLFVQHIRVGLQRRWKPGPRGPRFDLRRTLRSSLRASGEPLETHWLRRPRRAPKFIVLIDGSRSMGEHARTALRIAVAISSVTPRVEAFTFSTGLCRITGDVRRAAAGETRRLKSLQFAWAGGTSIGRCLKEFLRRFGERTMGRNTVVLVMSDGLDVGDSNLLRDAMRELYRRSAAVVWLNPLLASAGYEPTAEGMRVALPYLTTFATANDETGLARLRRLVHLRA